MTLTLLARVLGVSLLATAFMSGVTFPVDAKELELIKIEDRCDPATFNAVLGEGACVGDGNVTFQEFIARLQKKQTVGKWRFEPDKTDVKVGETVIARNDGGEVHTFTKVAHFGGGFVGILNALSRNTTPVPECVLFMGGNPVPDGNGDFVPAGTALASLVIQGGTFVPGASALQNGTNRFQCCIHPWMRTTITVESR